MTRKQNAVSMFFGVKIRRAMAVDPRRNVLLTALIAFCCNFLYALYHGVLGVLQISLWFLAICAFYSILAVMRFCVVLCGWKAKDAAEVSDVFMMKIAGLLLLLLSVVLAGINFISLTQNVATAYGKITMIMIAAYTFGKIVAVIIKAVRQRKNCDPLFQVLRNISYAEVAGAVLTLQHSMLISFGSMAESKIHMLNALTGAGVCLFILLLGVYMIMKSRKEHELWQNQNL